MNKPPITAAASPLPAELLASPAGFSYWGTLRLGTFQIGSAMGDILATSIWNRVLIANFGLPAWPVGLLIALRYFLTPISLWAGIRSDTTPIGGLYRTPYIWLGRGAMVLSLPFLGLSVGRLEADRGDPAGWLLAFLCFALYGAGSLLSGSPFLALVRDSAPPAKQGLAISMVETILITCFAIAGYVFGGWMPVYDRAVFWEMIVATMAIGGFFWFFAVAGAERRGMQPQPGPAAAERAGAPALRATFARIWQDQRTRRFFLFLTLATLAAWLQDTILEPFGAEVFGLEVRETTRFNSYWQGATVLTLALAAVLWRKRPPERQTPIARGGLLVMAASMALLAFSAVAGNARLVRVALLLFGFGFGVYTFGGLNLMVVMTSDREAGAYLGLWTIAVLVSRGVGISLGGALRDLFLALTASAAASYGLIFVVAAAGLAVAAFVLSGPYILSFARDTHRPGQSPSLPGFD